MTISELCGKLTPYERMEDLLTSDVFGTYRYLEPKQGLVPFLLRAVGFQHDNRPDFLNDVAEAEFIFWPRTTKLNREPDLLIVLTRVDGSCVSLLVEAKYRSGKSNINSREIEEVQESLSIQNNGHHDGDQLAESYKELREGNIKFRDNHEAEKKFLSSVGERYLFYVTAHFARPREDIEETFEILKKYGYRDEDLNKFYWLNWQEAIPAAEEVLQKDNLVSSRPVRNLIEDLIALLKRKGFNFSGYSNLCFNLSFYDCYFWKEINFWSNIETANLLFNEKNYFWEG
jgi:hypothetical protein